MKFWPPPIWWHNPGLSAFDQHPIAHALGGLVFWGGVMLAPWLYAHLPFQWFAALLASVFQLTWEIVQVEVTPGYSFRDSGLWDWLMATVVAVACATVWTIL